MSNCLVISRNLILINHPLHSAIYQDGYYDVDIVTQSRHKSDTQWYQVKRNRLFCQCFTSSVKTARRTERSFRAFERMLTIQDWPSFRNTTEMFWSANLPTIEEIDKGDPSKPISKETSIAMAIKSSRSRKSGNTDRKDKSRGSRCLRVDSDSDSDSVRDLRISNTVLITSKVGRVGIIWASSSKTSRRSRRDDNPRYLIHIYRQMRPEKNVVR